MAATALSRISLPLGQTLVQRAISVTVVILLPAVHPWPLRILPAPWHCYGQRSPASSTRSRQVATLWITRLSLSHLPSAATRVRPTTFTAGVGSISQRP